MAGRQKWLPLAGVLLAWLLTRLTMVTVVHWSGYPSPGAVTSDTRLYASWAAVLRTGHFPAADPSWQYPPGAAGVLLAPSLGGRGYHAAFLAMMLAVDLAVLLGLLYRGGRGAGTGAAWVWVAGIAAVGPVALNRFDLVPTALAVAGLLAASPYAAGALLGLGGLVKLWPAIVLPGVRERGWPVRTSVTMLAVVLTVLAALAGVGRLSEALRFASHTRDRGLQIESVAATPYLVVHAFSPEAGGLRIARRYGAYEVVGHYVGVGVALTALATVAGLVAYAVVALGSRRAERRDPAGLALAAVLLLIVTSKVLSPQYLVWAVGVGAVATSGRGRRHHTPVLLTILAAALTQGVFPGSYLSLLHARPAAVALLAVRNAVLLAAAVLAVHASAPQAVARRPDGATSAWRTRTFRAGASLEVAQTDNPTERP